MNKLNTLIILILLSFTVKLFAADNLTIVSIGNAEVEKTKITFLNVSKFPKATRAEKDMMKELMTLFGNDFSFYKKYFNVISENGLNKSAGDFNYDYWKGKNFKVVSKIEFQNDGILNYKMTSYNVFTKEIILEKSGPLVKSKLRSIGHDITNSLYKKLTGKTSIFKSKMIFVSNRNSSRKKTIKELYRMDFDGFNKIQLSKHGGIVVSPAISYDGNKVLYTLIKTSRKKRSTNLYILDLKTRRYDLVSKRRGINSGAIFLPGDKEIALTLTHQGNAEIYRMDLATKSLKRLTKHYSPDVDPSINVTGDLMVFLSGRPGKPMIYTSDPRELEKSVKRISFVGAFNATPRFSPDGLEIAFSSWLDNRFDIFRLDSSGSNLSRLTKDFGSNEDPTYSNDGQFIAFSSQRVINSRKAVHNIWVMDREGEILGQITRKYGHCITPRWSR